MTVGNEHVQDGNSTPEFRAPASERHAYLVVAAPTEERALELVNTNGVALVFLEHSMSDQAITEMAGEIRACYPQSPVLVLSELPENDDSSHPMDVLLRHLGSEQAIFPCLVEFPRNTKAA